MLYYTATIKNPLLNKGNSQPSLVLKESETPSHNTENHFSLKMFLEWMDSTYSYFFPPLPPEEKEKFLSFSEAFWKELHRSYYFISPRFLVLIKGFFNAFFAAGLSNPDAAVGLAMGTLFQQLALALLKTGSASIIDTLIPRYNLQDKEKNIGPLIYKTMIINMALSLLMALAFEMSDMWLKELGMDGAIANETSKFLKAIALGLPFIALSLVDQGFLQSLERKWSPTVLSSFFVSITMAISYPLALSTQDVSWFGYGLATASFLTFIAGRLHLWFNQTKGVLDRDRYQLFTKSLDTNDSKSSLWELFKLYVSSFGQGAIECGLPLLAAIWAGKDSETAANSQVAALQVSAEVTQIIQALGTQAYVVVSKYLATAEIYENNALDANAKNMIKNAKWTAYVMAAVSSVYILPIALLCVVYPEPIVKLFCHNDAASLSLANNMLRITGVTLWLDGLRNIWMSALGGRKQLQDNYFAVFTNLIIIAGAVTALGVFTQKEIGDLSVFMWKALGTFVAVATLGVYLEFQGDSRKSAPIFKSDKWLTCLTWKKAEFTTQSMSNVIGDEHINDDEESTGKSQHSVNSLSMSCRNSTEK